MSPSDGFQCADRYLEKGQNWDCATRWKDSSADRERKRETMRKERSDVSSDEHI